MIRAAKDRGETGKEKKIFFVWVFFKEGLSCDIWIEVWGAQIHNSREGDTATGASHKRAVPLNGPADHRIPVELC